MSLQMNEDGILVAPEHGETVGQRRRRLKREAQQAKKDEKK